MLEALPMTGDDPILALMGAFRADPRPDKLDLGVGVYRDETGKTPVFRAIRAAEARLHDSQRSKVYLGLNGDLDFVAAAARLSLGEDLAARAAGTQSVGGSGALFTLGRLAAKARPGAVAHLPDPTWPNHRNLLESAGLRIGRYPYFDPGTGALMFDAMCEALRKPGPGDVVVLHGCCHNPTGADLSTEQWREIAAIAIARGWLPLFDLAYQGFGAGVEADVAGMRAMLDAVPEALLAQSFSKNFGLYRDRAGAAFALSRDAGARHRAQAVLGAINREVISMPPDHGAALVRLVLEDATLRADWRNELERMRARIVDTRAQLAQALAARQARGAWAGLGAQRGMFSLLGLSDAQVAALREDHAIYAVAGGRINFAGLVADQVDRLADALIAVS